MQFKNQIYIAEDRQEGDKIMRQGLEKSASLSIRLCLRRSILIVLAFTALYAEGALAQTQKQNADQPQKAVSTPLKTDETVEAPAGSIVESGDSFLQLELVPPPLASETARFPVLKSEYVELKALWDDLEGNKKKYRDSVSGCVEGDYIPTPDSREQFGEYLNVLAMTDALRGELVDLIPLFNSCEAIKDGNVMACNDKPFKIKNDLQKNKTRESAEGLCPTYYFLWKLIATISAVEPPMLVREISQLCAAKGQVWPNEVTREQCVDTFAALGEYAQDGNPAVCEKIGIESLKPFCRAMITGENSYCSEIIHGPSYMPLGCGIITDIVNGMRAEEKDKNLSASITKKYQQEMENLRKNASEDKPPVPVLWYPLLMSNIYTIANRTDACYYLFYMDNKSDYCKYFTDKLLNDKIIPEVLKYQEIQPIFDNKYKNEIEIESRPRISIETEEEVEYDPVDDAASGSVKFEEDSVGIKE